MKFSVTTWYRHFRAFGEPSSTGSLVCWACSSCQAASRIASASGVSHSLRRSTRCYTGCGLKCARCDHNKPLSRLCLKRGCRLGPLSRQIEIDLAPSRIDRQLGHLSALLGVLLIGLLQFRQVVAVASYNCFSAAIIVVSRLSSAEMRTHLTPARSAVAQSRLAFIGVTNAHSSRGVATAFRSGH